MRGAHQAAAALPIGGRWVAMWSRENDPALTEVLADVSSRVAPNLVAERRDARDRESALVGLVTAGLTACTAFEHVERHEVSWTDHVTVGRLVARWSTHSGHRVSAPGVADDLHGTLPAQLGGPERAISLDDTTMILTARRR